MKRWFFAIVLLAVALGLIAGCGPTPTPQVVTKEVTKIVPKEVTKVVSKEVTKVVKKEVTRVVVVTATPAPAAAQPAAGGGAAANTIAMAKTAYDPAVIVVSAGSKVTWVNKDNTAHTVTSNDGLFDSGNLSPGDSFDFTFDKPGRYDFHCEIHPKQMWGSVIVQAEGEKTAFGGKPVAAFFSDTCGGCHAPDRRGGTGPALIPGRLLAPDDFYWKTIHDGRPGTIMPVWGEQLSDTEITSLVAFIKSPASAAAMKWTMEDIKPTREVLVPKDKWPAKPTHSGDMKNLMLVTEREARRIAVIDGDTFKLLKHVEASYRAHGYTFDPTSDRWAYNVGRDGWLFKIDLYSLQAVTKVRVGLDSRGIAISDDGKWIIVGNYIPHSAVIVKADTLEPVKVISTDNVEDPDGKMVGSRVCITSDASPKLVGPYFVIALKEGGQMWRIDWSKPDFPIVKVKNVGHILHDGFFSPDNKRFYVASQTDNWMAVIDVANWKLLDKIPTGKKPHPGSGATWTWNGKTYGATVHIGEGTITVWNLADNKIAAKIPTGGPGLFIRTYEGDESYPYVWADSLFGKPGNRIYIFNKSDFKVAHVIQEGTMTLHPEFTADGKYVYVSDWKGDTVRVYDANTFKKVAEITGIKTPTGIFNTHRRLETMGH